jgi:hypothetical protein
MGGDDVKTRPRSVPSTGLCAKAGATRPRLTASSATARRDDLATGERGNAPRVMKQTSGKGTLLRERPELLKLSED